MYRDNRHLLVCSHFSTKVEDASLTSNKQETGTVSTTVPAPEDLKTAYICTSSFTFTFQSLNIQSAWTLMCSWLLFCHISTSSFVKRINVAEATYTHSSVVPKQTLHTMQAPKQFCSFQNMGKTPSAFYISGNTQAALQRQDILGEGTASDNNLVWDLNLSSS